MTIRVAFFGTPDFAIPALRAFQRDRRFVVPLVVTQPDRPSGRGRRPKPPPVKTEAAELGLKVNQPESIREPEALATLQEIQPDLLVVVAYGEFLSRAVREVTPHGALNAHPSLLPRYRGAAPIPAAILNGDDRTGVSIIKLVRRMDAGPLLAQQTVDLAGTETTGELSEHLAEVTASILPDTCAGWVGGRIEPQPQDESQASYAREWSRDDARIDWTGSATHIERLVRAANPWPVAWTTVGGDPLRVHSLESADLDPFGVSGLVERRGKAVVVQAGDGVLALETVQPAGRPPMDATSWWNGLQRDQVQFEA